MSRPAPGNHLWWTDVRPDDPRPRPARPPKPPIAKPIQPLRPVRQCAACGEPFTLPRRNSRQRFCSDTCREAADERERQRRLREKLCRGCGVTKPLEQFGKDPGKRDGRMSRCSECANAARRARYYANLDHEHERNREWYGQNREKKQATNRAWQQANPEKMREIWQASSRRRKGTRTRDPRLFAEWKERAERERALLRALVADDHCYLCQGAFAQDDKICIDHDHSCCSSRHSSGCPACARGVAHEWCNQIIGLAGEDGDLLLTITRTFPLADATAKARIAAGLPVTSTGRHRGLDRPALHAAQGGDCYLCLRPMSPLPSRQVHADHDGTCPLCGPSTAKGTRSCPACRRGLAHAACNQLIGLAGEDTAVLRLIADSFAPVRAAVRERIAAKAEQGAFGIAA